MASEKPRDEPGPVFVDTGLGNDTMESFTKEGYKVLMEAIKNSNALPLGRDFNFYNAHESFVKIMTDEGNSILQSMNSILRKYEIEGNVKNRSLEEKTDLVVEANDTILENVANHIDEMNGIKKCTVEPVVIQTVSAQLPINGSWNSINRATFSVSSSLNNEHVKNKSPQQAIRLLTAKNIVRPQKFFKDIIDNSSSHPWEPRIKDKPNSLKPLAIFLEETENGDEYSHPYEFELERFNPPQEQLKEQTPIRPKPLTETPLIQVSTEDKLNSLLEDLRKYKEIAVDLEHHSYRSFLGITCLMQISTQDTDYLIDTLALRDKLWILNEVFTKPSIVKIFHGADSDIQWLQRDLSLYVVNMFDTHQAAKQLSYSGRSLSYLLKKFCNFMPNKHFQLADWRIRPLPDELKNYAREDTHYLIYIYHMLTNELLKKNNGKDNILKSVYQQSTQICRKRYLKPLLKEDSHMEFYRKCKRLFNNRQLYALRELYRWRDQISRAEDESTGYVLPNHMLLQIAEALPREMQGILACCNPVPPLVRANLLELHQIILRAREQSVEKPILKEEIRGRGSAKQLTKINVDSPLNCPHDLSGNQEFRDDLPTLLGSQSEIYKNKNDLTLEIEKVNPLLSVFESENGNDDSEKLSNSKIKQLKFLGPYERYKLVKPFVEAEEKALEEKQKNMEDSVKEQSMEDRIASLHEHFVQVVKTIPQPAQTSNKDEANKEPVSLIGMGGSRKRTHREMEEYSNHDYDMQQSIKAQSSDLQTPVPQIHAKQVKGNRNRNKRKYSEVEGSHNYQSNNKKQKTNQSNYQSKKIHIQQPAASNRDNNQKKNKRNKFNKMQNNSDLKSSGNSSNNYGFVPYDYSAVDFRQFQGGAGGAPSGQQVKSTFRNRGKGRNRGRGGNNKSSIFANNKGKRF